MKIAIEQRIYKISKGPIVHISLPISNSLQYFYLSMEFHGHKILIKYRLKHRQRYKQMKRQIIIVAIILSSIVNIQPQVLYKIPDFFRNPIEYRTPFTFSLFDIKVGTQINGFTENSTLFDST